MRQRDSKEPTKNKKLETGSWQVEVHPVDFITPNAGSYKLEPYFANKQILQSKMGQVVNCSKNRQAKK